MNVPQRTTRKRTTASRRARRKSLGLTQATARGGLDTGGAPVIPIRCVCDKRLADVVTVCRRPPERWTTRDWSRLPFSEPLEGAWLEHWQTELDLRNRKGVAGEIHLEGRWRVTCPRCKARHSGMTAQLVRLVMRSVKAGAVVLSGPNLANCPADGPYDTLERMWVNTGADPRPPRTFGSPSRP